jgi:RNA-directed DNA polymerase
LFKTGSYFQPGIDGSGAAPISALAKLEGILNHIYFVKDEADPRELKKKVDCPTAARTLYKDFLFFKYFVRLEKPLILCEGKTDAIYLKSAIQNLTAFHPKLATAQGKSVNLNISFFNYTNLAHKVLDIRGGCGGQLALIRDYESLMPKFAYAPLKHPVIVLVDNDSGPGGAGGLFSLVNQKFKLNPSLTSNAPFYALRHNLFLVKTPEKANGDGSSKIEDLFDPSFLATAVDGKVFNSSNKKSAANEIGKTALAGIVRAHADKIDFSHFAVLLNRIVGVIDQYKAGGG